MIPAKANLFSIDSTLLTVRALGLCRSLKLQEFARVIFVDRITNYTSLFEDYEPLKERPAYDALDVPKIVCLFNEFSIFRLLVSGNLKILLNRR